MGKPVRTPQLVNLGISSGVVRILAVTTSAAVGAAQTSLQEQNDPTFQNSAAALAVAGGTAILVGFTTLTVLGNRTGKLKDKLIEAQNPGVASSIGSSVELSGKDNKSSATVRA